MHVSYATFISLAVLASAQIQINYDCTNQAITCTNICYWHTCIQPTVDVFTRDIDATRRGQRRTACGVNHRPRPCSGSFPGFSAAGDWTDEFPFASTMEGGRTPNGDGASLLCTPGAEQRVQAAYITNHIANFVADGAQFQLNMFNEAGIEYCDPAATHNGCDGTKFNGFHYFDTDDVYCQWDISASDEIQCLDGQGNSVDPPAKAKRSTRLEQPREANFSNLLHIREPGLAKRLMEERPVELPAL